MKGKSEVLWTKTKVWLTGALQQSVCVLSAFLLAGKNQITVWPAKLTNQSDHSSREIKQETVPN